MGGTGAVLEGTEGAGAEGEVGAEGGGVEGLRTTGTDDVRGVLAAALGEEIGVTADESAVSA